MKALVVWHARSKRCNWCLKLSWREYYLLGVAATIMSVEQVCGFGRLSEKKKQQQHSAPPATRFIPSLPWRANLYRNTTFQPLSLRDSIQCWPWQRWVSQSYLGWSWLCPWPSHQSFPSLWINPGWKRRTRDTEKPLFSSPQDNPTWILQESRFGPF